MTRTRLGTAGVLLLAAVVPYVLPALQVRLATLSLIWFIVVLGLHIVLGQTGLMSLGQMAFVGLGAYTSAILAVNLGLPFWLSMPLGGLVSGATAVLIGFPTLKLKGHYLAIASLGLGQIIHQLLLNFNGLTRGADGIAGIPRPSVFGMTVGSATAYFYLALGCAVVLGVLTAMLTRSNLGLAFRAIKLDELAAESNGLNVAYYKVLSFALAAFLAGLGGAIFAHFEGFISPDAFNVTQSIVLLTMLVLGGSRSVVGSLIGAALVTFLPQYLRFLGNSYLIVYGTILLVTVLFAPGGVEGIIENIMKRRRKSTAERPVIPT